MWRFEDPWWLLLGLVIPLLALIYWLQNRRKVRSGTLVYSNLGAVKGIRNGGRYRHAMFALRSAALALLIVAMARPQAGQVEQEITTEGIDIVLTLDISSSMLAEDFKPHNRLEAAKVVASDFIRGRTSDRIGLVVFAAKSFTQCPLTLDYGILLDFIRQVEIGMIEDGTAIGMAIATAASRLKDSKAESKVIILLTDGENNRGQLDPITAAKVAKAFGIRIYTVGMGRKGEALYPVDHPIFGRQYRRVPVKIDEKMLKEIARLTDGKYFRATDKSSLDNIFKEIDQLEKTKIEVEEYTRYEELFPRFLLAGLGLVFLEIVVSNTRFRKIP